MEQLEQTCQFELFFFLLLHDLHYFLVIIFTKLGHGIKIQLINILNLANSYMPDKRRAYISLNLVTDIEFEFPFVKYTRIV